MSGNVPQTLQCFKTWKDAAGHHCFVRFDHPMPPDSYVCFATTKGEAQAVRIENREHGIIVTTLQPDPKGFDFMCEQYPK